MTLKDIAQKSAHFICKNKCDTNALAEVTQLIESRINSFFTTIARSLTDAQSSKGVVLSDGYQFTSQIKECLLSRINPRENPEELMDFIYIEMCDSGGLEEKNWRLAIEGNQLTLHSLIADVTPMSLSVVPAEIINL